MRVLLVITILVAAFVAQNSAEDDSHQPLCMCPKIFAPVCGTDLVTYANLCLLDCEKERKPDLEAKFHGDCEGAHMHFPLDELEFLPEA